MNKRLHSKTCGLKNINIVNTTVTDLYSCVTCFDSATFVIDEKSENVIEDLSCLKIIILYLFLTSGLGSKTSENTYFSVFFTYFCPH